jgi:hypothetical protein
MWGEWFDAVSCLVAFSSTAKHTKPVEVANFRHTLVRLMSLCHGSALEEIADTADEEEGYPCIDLGGLDQDTLRYLKECKFNPDLDFNRVEVIVHMIQTLIVSSNEAGVLKIPPPILSRVFQTISRGQVNLANCKKITATLFPFPFAQLIACLLLIFNVLTPIIMSSILDHPLMAFIATVLPCFGIWSLNYVAGELEIPFGRDVNDLPLLEFQEHMNSSMLMLSRAECDIVPSTCSRCHLDYASMKANISTKRPRNFITDDVLEGIRQESQPAEAKDVGAARGPANLGGKPTAALKQAPIAPPAAKPADAHPSTALGAAEQKVIDLFRESVGALEKALKPAAALASTAPDAAEQKVADLQKESVAGLEKA